MTKGSGERAPKGDMLSKKDPKNSKNKSELVEETHDAHNGFSKQRKGKNSKFTKLGENEMIMKSAS